MNLNIIRSRRRSISLEVKADASLVIRVPRNVPNEYIQALIVQKQAWIKRKQQQAMEREKLRVELGTIDVEECKQRASAIIPQRVELYSQQTGIKYNKIRISNARRRWGSCSAKGNLNFSWRLALAPLEVIDYVVVHELAHIIHKNHSKKFWKLVAAIYPNYKLCRKWLRDKGRLL